MRRALSELGSPDLRLNRTAGGYEQPPLLEDASGAIACDQTPIREDLTSAVLEVARPLRFDRRRKRRVWNRRHDDARDHRAWGAVGCVLGLLGRLREHSVARECERRR